MKNLNSRVLAGAAIASAAVLGVSGLTAGHADAGKLPGFTKHKNLGDGNSITIKLTDEAVRVTRPVTNVPTSREVFVSGKVRVSTSGEVKGANVTAGYLVGCQLTFGAGASGGVESGDLAEAVSSGELAASTEAGGEIKLGPGEAGYATIINLSDDDGDGVDSFSFGNAKGGVAYSQERFGVDGCAGYAEARAMVTVKVSTDTFKGNITAYGKPFSLG